MSSSGRGWAIVPAGEYLSDWADLAKLVKDAAGWRCVRCDHPHDRSTWHVLTVHHLDGNKANSAWWNLLALCQRCHLSVQGRVDPHRPYLLEHTAWFRPYVGGFYAEQTWGEHLERWRVEANLIDCLRAGQPWLSYGQAA